MAAGFRLRVALLFGVVADGAIRDIFHPCMEFVIPRDITHAGRHEFIGLILWSQKGAHESETDKKEGYSQQGSEIDRFEFQVRLLFST